MTTCATTCFAMILIGREILDNGHFQRLVRVAADGGVNPLTRERVVDADSGKYALAVMATAGMYETSGDWLYDIGLPGKSGVSGGIITVAPGKGGLGTFSPPLDRAGNSVRGQRAALYLSDQLGLDLFVSRPATTANP